MRRARPSSGFAMLAALVVVVLAATFALVVAAAVQGEQAVERSDASAWRAATLGGRALTAVATSLRWQPGATAGGVEGEDGGLRAWRASWSPAPPMAGVSAPRVRVLVEAGAGAARRREELTLELRPEPWAAGVTCEEDAEVMDELVVSASGVYVGGCLRGRERVRFVAGAVTGDGRPADAVRGDAYPVAAVHGGVGIYARGAEIHEGGASVEFPDDTDRHAGQPVSPAWLDGPSAEFLVAAESAAHPVGPWFEAGTVRLDAVPPAAGDTGGGRCVVLPAADEVVIEGAAPPAAGRLLLVVRGDAVIGQPGSSVALDGGLVVLGRLTVRGSFRLTGPLHVRSLAVEAPTSIALPPDWQTRPVCGATVPTVVERGG